MVSHHSIEFILLSQRMNAMIFPLGITLQDIAAFVPRFLGRLYTDSLMYGNLTREVISVLFIRLERISRIHLK